MRRPRRQPGAVAHGCRLGRRHRDRGHELQRLAGRDQAGDVLVAGLAVGDGSLEAVERLRVLEPERVRWPHARDC